MNSGQWETLLNVIRGETQNQKSIGFLIDSPWLPGWFNVSVLDYYVNAEIWFEANKRVTEEFPDVMFLPGFWSEFGMCTEPSAFGSKMIWSEHNLPYPGKIFDDGYALGALTKPDVRTDGLLPFVLKRLQHNEERIKANGHLIKFAVTRGPLNIASFLTGTTEFMMAVATMPEETQRGMQVITDFIIDWLTLQMETFPDIDGILLLDDLVGFLGESDYKVLAHPCLKKIFDSFDVKVKFFHNDAHGLVCAPFLNDMGVNLFNFSFEHSMDEMKKLTGRKITLLGNIPPRDVLANGTPQDVRNSVKQTMDSISDHTRVIWSCGGGMPPEVSTENLRTFINAVKEWN